MLRYVGHKPKLLAIVRALRANRWYISIVLRVSPVPLGLQNGLLAITVPFHVFILSLPFAFPEQCLFVYFGREVCDASVSRIAFHMRRYSSHRRAKSCWSCCMAKSIWAAPSCCFSHLTPSLALGFWQAVLYSATAS